MGGVIDSQNLPDRYVVVNFLSPVIFVFRSFLGMVMYANEVETKRNKREIKKNKLQHMYQKSVQIC